MQEIQICYPRLQFSEMRLYHSADSWATGEIANVDPDQSCYKFQVAANEPIFFKPAIVPPNGSRLWSVGANYVSKGAGSDATVKYPYFQDGSDSEFLPLAVFAHDQPEPDHDVWLYRPSGFHENPLKHYPLAIIHDSEDLSEWGLKKTLDGLMDSRALDKLQVAVISHTGGEKSPEFTQDYRQYGTFIVEQVLPLIERRLEGPRNCALMGVSLGGLVSLALAWERPSDFGACAALSASLLSGEAFKQRGADIKLADDLRRKFQNEQARNIKIYLDAGVNEALHSWAALTEAVLRHRGYRADRLLFQSLREHGHSHDAWSARFFLALQYLFNEDDL